MVLKIKKMVLYIEKSDINTLTVKAAVFFAEFFQVFIKIVFSEIIGVFR